MTMYIRPYGRSDSAFKLAVALGIQRIMKVRNRSIDISEDEYTRYREDADQLNDIIINWGNSTPHAVFEEWNTFNTPEAVAVAVNKKKTFQVLSNNDIPTLTWTTDRDTACSWAMFGDKVFCRTLTNSRLGKGIIVCTGTMVPPIAKLYTKGETVKREYRVHVVFGNVIDLTAKCLRKGGEQSDIQSWGNGYIFARNSVKIPDKIREALHALALRTLEVLDLDFGAVDIIRNTEDQLKVLEVNTAPGIEGTTLERYVEAFRTMTSTY